MGNTKDDFAATQSVRVRYGLVDYRTWDQRLDREVTKFAFRGQVVDIPSIETDRLRRLGAVVDSDMELSIPGAMMTLPTIVSDEELLRWIADATPSEIVALTRERPEMAVRIAGARSTIEARRRESDERLGMATQIVKDNLQTDDEGNVVTGEDFTIVVPKDRLPRAFGGDAYDDPSADPGASVRSDGVTIAPGDPSRPSQDQGTAVVPFAEIVTGNVDDVRTYLGEHPEHADQIVEAEIQVHGSARAGVEKAAAAAKRFASA